MRRALLFILLLSLSLKAETFDLIREGAAPQDYAALWADYDPRAEPLDVEVLHEWEESGVVLKVLRFRVGVFKGQKAMMAAIYAYPKGGSELPGLVNIHGGGQFADFRAPLTNAKRGYATITLAWAGRLNAPGYKVTSDEVKLFWEQATEHPDYKVTTDWGALDIYHAPTRFSKSQFGKTLPTDWTLDTVDSPRNSQWFFLAVNARRALTFLEQQPEVDPSRLGVYGHSMGGKQTVLTAGSDNRVKAAVPSCGGISDRTKGSALYQATINDNIYLENMRCPILFQSPSNDFHGRIDDLQTSLKEIQTDEWRLSCSPHHNHQDTKDYEVVSQLWFDQHLKGTFEFPQTPTLKVKVNAETGIPMATVELDASKPIAGVQVCYTRHGQMDGLKDNRSNTVNRFWYVVDAVPSGQKWEAELPLCGDDTPLWVYANVRYELEEPVDYAGYYYGVGASDTFMLSSKMFMASAEDLASLGAQSTVEPSRMIESFDDGWANNWFSYRPKGWARQTHKVYDAQWKAPSDAKLSFQVSAERANTLVVKVDDFAAEVELDGGGAWEAVVLSASDFQNAAGEPLVDFQSIRELGLSDRERLRARSDGQQKTRVFGGTWQGSAPIFNDLHWVSSDSLAVDASLSEEPVSLQKRRPDTYWTYKTVGEQALKLSVFLPDGYSDSDQLYPVFVVYHGGSWQVGEASWHYPDCTYWSQRGMVAVSVDYRLGKRDGVEVPLECVKDAKSAIRFLRKHADALKLDPDRIVAAGGSAAGQLAAAVAMVDTAVSNDSSYDLSVSCVPNAVVTYNPYYKCVAELSPPNFIATGLPPMISFLGDDDPAITVDSLRSFHDHLKATDNHSEYYVAKGGKHGLCNGRNPKNPYFYWSLELIDQFLVKADILSGGSLVQIPEGVKKLVPSVDYAVYL